MRLVLVSLFLILSFIVDSAVQLHLRAIVSRALIHYAYEIPTKIFICISVNDSSQ